MRKGIERNEAAEIARAMRVIVEAERRRTVERQAPWPLARTIPHDST